MQTILVINSKGGSGKSTVSSNLAAWSAAAGHGTVILDYDPQGSSIQWLAQRPAHLPRIHGIHASERRAGVTRVWQMKVPPGTERIILDAPAGVTGHALQDIVRRAGEIIVPVAPSPIDIHATAAFIRELLLVGKARRYGARIAVVANRVRRDGPQYEPLRKFLNSLGMPFITSLTDSDRYIEAAERGIGIHEMAPEESREEREQWRPLLDWLTGLDLGVGIAMTPRLNVVSGRR